MREVFHGELARLGAEVATAVRMVATQLRLAMTEWIPISYYGPSGSLPTTRNSTS